MIGRLASLSRLCGKHLFIGSRMNKGKSRTMDYHPSFLQKMEDRWISYALPAGRYGLGWQLEN
jgi:hypothetical protein